MAIAAEHTPAYRTWFARGGGTNATSCSTSSSAVSTWSAMPLLLK